MADIQSIANNNYVLQSTLISSGGVIGDGSPSDPFRLNENVLYSGSAVSSAGLNDNPNNYEYLKIYTYMTGANPNPIVEMQPGSIMTFSYGLGDANTYLLICRATADNSNFAITNTKRLAFGSFTSTANITSIAANTATPVQFTKIVGINKK